MIAIPVRLVLNWKYQGPNAPFALAADRGFFAEAGLDVTMSPGGGSSLSTEQVAFGQFDAGFGDVNALIEQAGRGGAVDAVTVAILYSRAPMVVVSRKTRKFRAPRDLIGATLASPDYDTGFRMFPALARAGGIDPASVTLRAVSPAERDRLLIAGEVDGVTGFDSTIVFALRAAGQDPADFALMYYDDHGVDVYSSALIVARSFASTHPGATAGLVRAVLRGWRAAIEDPDAAIDAIVRREATIDRALARAHLDWVIEHQVRTQEVLRLGIGAADPARLERNLDIAQASFALARRPAREEIFDPAFLPREAR